MLRKSDHNQVDGNLLQAPSHAHNNAGEHGHEQPVFERRDLLLPIGPSIRSGRFGSPL